MHLSYSTKKMNTHGAWRCTILLRVAGIYRQCQRKKVTSQPIISDITTNKIIGGSTCPRIPLSLSLCILAYPFLERDLRILIHADDKRGKLVKPHDCKDLREDFGQDKDGVYTVFVGDTYLRVYCDMTTDGGGWTVCSNTPKTRFTLEI